MSRPPLGARAFPSSTRRFFLAPSSVRASGVNEGATMHSTKSAATAWAQASSTSVVKAITEPNADTGSQASAF